MRINASRIPRFTRNDTGHVIGIADEYKKIVSSDPVLLAMTLNDVILTPQAEGSFLTSSFLDDGLSSQAY